MTLMVKFKKLLIRQY